MKSALVMLALLFTVISCTQQPPASENGGNPGDERSTNPITIGTEETGLISMVCSSLNEKMYVLDDYVVHRELLRVIYQESDCGGKLPGAIRDDVRIIKNGSEYAFQNDSINFRMTEVETLNSGSMKEVCAALNIGSLKNPVITASHTAVEVTAADTEICRSDSQHVCVQIRRGPVSEDGLSYKVSETTQLKFRTVGDHRGFYVFKNQKNFSTCSEGKFRTKIASFF